MSLTSKDFPYEVPELHCHVRSDKDAFIFPKKLAERLKELGMPGIAITDHGVVSSIEDYRHVLQAEGLKVIPGCELYIDGGKILGRQHGIILAVDDTGWHGIGKIVTRSNETRQGAYPVISADELKEFGRKYKGHIIFMTACMQGVIATIYLANNKIDTLVKKAEEKQKKYISHESDKYKEAEEKLKDIDGRIEELKMLRDEDKRLAEMKFSAREKKAGKLEGEERDRAFKEIENDKKASEKAKKELDKIKGDIKDLQKKRTGINKAFQTVKTGADKYKEYAALIRSYEEQKLTHAQMDERAQKELLSYVDAFGDGNVYAEVQFHGIPEEEICFTRIAALAKRTGVPLIATNDVHMLTNSKDDMLRRCLLRSMRFGKEFEAPAESDKELYLKTTDERIEALSKILSEKMIKEALSNAIAVFERCNVEFKTEEHYPVASNDPKRDLEALVKKGIAWRFPDGFPDREVYEARLAKELDTIESMGYDNYHLVVREFLTYGTMLGKVPKERIPESPVDTDELGKWIKDNGWEDNAGYRIGTGRGSDGGSLVCFLLGITNLDPIKHGLIFERFLNKERVSMPDIDSDISADTRQKLIDHVKYVYGQKAVCGIMTTNAQGPKGAIAIGAKYYGLREYGQSLRPLGDLMAKDVPDAPGTGFSTQVDRITGKIDECSKDTVSVGKYLTDKWILENTDPKQRQDCKEIIYYASVMEGVFTSYGAHAAGIVIVEKGTDVSDVLPLMWNDKLGMMTTQCAKDDVEANGLLKFDFLGLKTLDIITEALQMIQNRTGEAIDVLKLDTADENIYRDIFQTGNTKAVFQFESDGMRNMLKRFHPTEFSDLVLLNAAYRPGPMQYLDDIVEIKNGRKEPEYLTPQLEPILKDTYGAMIYQEQVMQVCQKLAGYSFGAADLVRRAMSKKKKEKLAHERQAFVYGDKERNIAGCVNNGISADTANEIFDQMMAFASYAFNKSHAAAYAYNAYITAYLKEYYPAEFFAAALNWAADQDEVSGLVYDAKKAGVGVLSPDINISEKDFTADEENVRFALSAVKGINTGANGIIKERRENGPFKSLQDFLVRTGTGASAVENLIYAGAFDRFSENRKALSDVLPGLSDLAKKYRNKQAQAAAVDAVLAAGVPDTAEAVIKAQEDAGVKVCIKEPVDAYKLEDKVEPLSREIRDIGREMASVRADESVYEDKKERLSKEKEMLGLYISASPLDYCPDNKDLDPPCAYISDAGDNTTKLYGVCGSVRVTKRKKDGAEMAFFTISDRTGEIACACFAKSYPYVKQFIKDGEVAVFTGRMMRDRAGEDEEKLQFSVEKAVPVSERKDMLVLAVKSYALFHIDGEKAFREKYEDEKGRKFLIYDEAMNEFREPEYLISDDAAEDKEYNIREFK